MKVVALMKEASWSGDRVFLVEMTAEEIATVIGKRLNLSKISIGMQAKPDEIYRHTEKILANRHVTENAAKNLRAMAELLDSMDQIVADAVDLEPEQTAENEE